MLRSLFIIILLGLGCFLHQSSTFGQDSIAIANTLPLQDSTSFAIDSGQYLSPSVYDTLLRIVLEDFPIDSLKQNFDIQPIKEENNSALPFYALLFIIGIFGYVRFNFFSYIYAVRQSFFNINLAQQFFEEHVYSVSPASFFLNLNAVLIYTLLAFLSLRYFGKMQHIGDMSLVGIALAAVLAVGLSRYWAYRVAAYILPIEKTLLFYLFNIRILNYVMSAALVPLLLILAFADNAFLEGTIWLIFIVIISFGIYRCYRGILIGEETMKYNKFHFFVYLCTFEIAPILILYKIIEILLV